MESPVPQSSIISSDIATLIRKARIAAGLTQAALAAQAGCTQSAVSMFEAGKRDALSRESIGKIAKILNIEVGASVPASPDASLGLAGTARASASPLPYCPNFDCPSNHAYQVGVSVFLLPTGAAGGGKHCVLCGEAVSTLCHGCGAEVRRGGACCSACGEALVVFPEGFVDVVAEWVIRHNETAEAVRDNIFP